MVIGTRKKDLNYKKLLIYKEIKLMAPLSLNFIKKIQQLLMAQDLNQQFQAEYNKSELKLRRQRLITTEKNFKKE